MIKRTLRIKVVGRQQQGYREGGIVLEVNKDEERVVMTFLKEMEKLCGNWTAIEGISIVNRKEENND